MATVDDIDTEKAVRKYLQRDTLTPKTDESADTGEETQQLLESVATSFLLFPQAVLSIILRGKNSLRQVVDSDIQVIDFIIKSLGEVRNPDTPISDTSDLVEAQTALVELDRLGRVSQDLQAYERYEGAIGRFLEVELGPHLKRNSRKEFERSGTEAKEDVFSMLQSFGPMHRVMIDSLVSLQNAVVDFQLVSLETFVSTKVIAKVRESLRQIKTLMDNDGISKTTAAIELLAGSASLQSISSGSGVYDPTIDTGERPVGRSVWIRPEAAAATMVTSDGPWDATNPEDKWLVVSVDVLSDPESYILELPDTGVADDSNRNTHYVTSSEDVASPTYEIPVSSSLYVRIAGYGGADEEWEVPITAGTRTVAQIVADINDPVNGLWYLGVQRGAAAEFKSGSGRFVIYVIDDGATPESITIRSASSGAKGGFNTDESVHELLGFSPYQTSLEEGQYTAESLMDALQDRLLGVSMAVEGDKLRITSDSIAPTSSLALGTHASGVEDVLGFPDDLVESQPSYVELIEDGVALDSEGEGVFVGSTVTSAENDLSKSPFTSAVRTLNNEEVTRVAGTELYFGQASLPRGTALSVNIDAPVVVSVQNLTRLLAPFTNDFDDDVDDLQLALSPILSSPTLAQVNDAGRLLNEIRDKLTNGSDGLLEILDSVVVRPDRSQYARIAEKVVSSLEERGLDRAVDLLVGGKFSEFFGLDKNNASKSSRLLRSMEESMVNDVPVSVIDQDIDDGAQLFGENPDDVLDKRELSNEASDLAWDEENL